MLHLLSRYLLQGEVSFSTYVKKGTSPRTCSRMYGTTYLIRTKNDHTFSIARYDAFAYGTAYLIRPTKSNDPTSGLFRASPIPHKGHLSLSQ